MYELLLEGREGAGAVRLGGWCQGGALALFPLEIGVF